MARPNPWGSPGGPLPAQFANSFSTGNPRNGNARENVSGTSPFDALMPMNTGFSGFPGKSAAIDGSMLGGAMGGSAVHSFAMHRRGAFHSTFSLALSPTGRNPAAPSNAFPPTAEGIFSTGNANSFSTDKPTEAPVADRAFRKADSRCRNAFRGSPAGSQMGTSRNGSCNLSAHALHTDLSTACAQCIMAEARSRAKDGIFPSISRTKEAKAPFRQQRR